MITFLSCLVSFLSALLIVAVVRFLFKVERNLSRQVEMREKIRQARVVRRARRARP